MCVWHDCGKIWIMIFRRGYGKERRDALSYFLIIVPSPRVARSALTISIDR